jgi:hypothetical protein
MGISITYFFGLRMGVRMGMVLIYNQLLISGKYSKNKIFQSFPKKSYKSKKRTLQLFGTTFYFSPHHQ